jgi:hypothetical protein
LDIVERPFLQESTDFTGLLLLASLMTISLLNIQASSPLQVKYADGELERLGMINVYVDLMSLSDFYMGLSFWSVLSTDM